MSALEEPRELLELIARREAHRDDAIGDVNHIHSDSSLCLKALLLPIDQFLSEREYEYCV